MKNVFILILTFLFSSYSHAVLVKIYSVQSTNNFPTCLGPIDRDSILNLPDYSCVGLPVGDKDNSVWGEAFFRGNDVYITFTHQYGTYNKQLAGAVTIGTCPNGLVFDDVTNSCGKPKTCTAGEMIGTQKWAWSVYGTDPVLCFQNCQYQKNGVSDSGNICSIGSDKCYGDFKGDGKSCTSNGLKSGGEFPEPPPDGCSWTGTSDDRTLVCNGDDDGDGSPDPDGIPNPDGSCHWDGMTLVCNGGGDSGGGDSGGGDSGGGDSGGGDSGGGDSGGGDKPSTDLSGVINAITKFNNDNNKNLDENTEKLEQIRQVNELARTTNQQDLFALKKSVNKSGKKTVDALDNLNDGISNTSNNVTAMKYTLNSISDILRSIKNGIDGILNTSTENARFEDCYTMGTCKSMYESNYEEYDSVSDMVSERMNGISTGILKQVTDTFINIDVSNAQKPNTSACLDFGFIDYGCFDFFKDFSWIWAFVKVAFIFTAIMTARKLVFGG